MTFEQVVKMLKPFHQALWFCCRSSPEELFHAECWQGGTITTTGGKLLAFQVGHPDEWKLTILANQPDTGLVIDEPDVESEITEEFLVEVRFYMVMLVHTVYDCPPEPGI